MELVDSCRGRCNSSSSSHQRKCSAAWSQLHIDNRNWFIHCLMLRHARPTTTKEPLRSKPLMIDSLMIGRILLFRARRILSRAFEWAASRKSEPQSRLGALSMVRTICCCATQLLRLVRFCSSFVLEHFDFSSADVSVVAAAAAGDLCSRSIGHSVACIS